jgi:cytoskeleton protein RodZ
MASEEGPKHTNQASDTGGDGPVGGERLAEARRARGVSVLEIAKELHLDEPKVRALEENRFEVLGAPVFAKGHLRKYAELVGVSIDDILADYYQMNRAPSVPPVVRPRKMSREISFGPWIAGIAIAVILGAATWWWFSLQPAPVTVRTPVAAEPESPESQSTEVTEREPPPAPEDSVTPATEPEVLLDEGVPPTEPVVEEEPAQDCWTEVTDAAGRRLFFGLATEGRTITLNGVEPLGVLLGNSANVAMTVNGFDYTIPAANRRGNTARLTIYGQ